MIRVDWFHPWISCENELSSTKLNTNQNCKVLLATTNNCKGHVKKCNICGNMSKHALIVWHLSWFFKRIPSCHQCRSSVGVAGTVGTPMALMSGCRRDFIGTMELRYCRIWPSKNMKCHQSSSQHKRKYGFSFIQEFRKHHAMIKRSSRKRYYI